MKKIVILTGSASDLDQVKPGLQYLQEQYQDKLSTEVSLHVLSCHRNLWELMQTCFTMQADVVIAGAGWAAALPGIANAILNGLLGKGIPVIGVGFKADPSLPEADEKDKAAELSITELPGHPVRYAGLGSEGFLAAAKIAVEEDLPTPKTGNTKAPLIDVDLSHFMNTSEVKSFAHQ